MISEDQELMNLLAMYCIVTKCKMYMRPKYNMVTYGHVSSCTCWQRADAPHSKNESLSFSHQTAGGKILIFTISFFSNAIYLKIKYNKNKMIEVPSFAHIFK